MFTRLILLTLCLTPLAGWAGEPQTELLQFTVDGSLKIDKASFDAMLYNHPGAKLRVLLTNDPCLATMEAAMRAMEPYLGVNPWFTYHDTNDQTVLKNWYHALDTFSDAKRCWRKP